MFCLGMLADTSAEQMMQDGLDVKLMSFNIRYGSARDGENEWKNRRDLMFDVLREEWSDVVGLQEAERFQLDEIRNALPEYSEVGVGRDDGKAVGEYSAILYISDRFHADEEGTFWFSETPEIPGSKDWGNSIPRICTWTRLVEKASGQSFYVYNVHLDHVSQQLREKSVMLLSERIQNREHQDPVVVIGDFNAGEENPAIVYLTRQASVGLEDDNTSCNNTPTLLDTFRVLHADASDVGTFHGFRGGRMGEKIDYILAPGNVRVLEAEIVYHEEGGRYPSDHFPVIARLRLPTLPRE